MNARLYKQIADRIAERIYSGRYKIGERLPTERELAEEFDIGRPVIREALIALELYGLVLIRQGAGIYVQPWQNQPLKVNIFDRGLNPFELIDARRIIECETAAAAAVIINERELLDLQHCLQKMKESHSDLGRYSIHDREFHTAIARAVRNSALSAIVDSLWALYTRGRYVEQYAKFMPREKLHGDRLDEHIAIYSALERHDPEGARTAMETHLKRSKSTLMEAAERMRADTERARIA
jgi:GntR family transcriptional repressor for pyruvate dehydrogenase complex